MWIFAKCDEYFSYQEKKAENLKSVNKSSFISVTFFSSYTEYVGNWTLVELSMISLIKNPNLCPVLKIIVHEAFHCSYLEQDLTNEILKNKK